MTQPLPSQAELGKPFWQGALNDKLHIQECRSCGLRRYPDAPVCAQCKSADSHWVEISGLGTITAWCRFHRKYFEGFTLPHTVLLIKLDGGPQLFGNWASPFSGMQPAVGMQVEPVFEWIADNVKMPRFRPAQGNK